MTAIVPNDFLARMCFSMMILFLAVPCWSKTTLRVSFTRDQVSTPVEGVFVTLKSALLKTTHSVSDSDGVVEFKELGAGEYHLAAEKGNLVVSQAIRVPGGSPDQLPNSEYQALMKLSLRLMPGVEPIQPPVAMRPANTLTDLPAFCESGKAINHLLIKEGIVCITDKRNHLLISPSKLTSVTFHRLRRDDAQIDEDVALQLLDSHAAPVLAAWIAWDGVQNAIGRLHQPWGCEATLSWLEGDIPREAAFHLNKRNYAEFLEGLRQVSGRDWIEFDATREASELKLIVKQKVRLGEYEVAAGTYKINFSPGNQGGGMLYIFQNSSSGERTVAKALAGLYRKNAQHGQFQVALTQIGTVESQLCEIRTAQYVFRFQACDPRYSVPELH